MVAPTKTSLVTDAVQVVDRMEVLSVMIDALWLYLRSVGEYSSNDEQLAKKLQQANDSLYEIMSYLEEKN